MKITKTKYEKALASLSKLKKAQEIVNHWEQAKKQRAPTFAAEDVLEIELRDGRYIVMSAERDAQRRLVS